MYLSSWLKKLPVKFSVIHSIYLHLLLNRWTHKSILCHILMAEMWNLTPCTMFCVCVCVCIYYINTQYYAYYFESIFTGKLGGKSKRNRVGMCSKHSTKICWVESNTLLPETEWQGDGLNSKGWALLRSCREVGGFLLSSHIPNLSH